MKTQAIVLNLNVSFWFDSGVSTQRVAPHRQVCVNLWCGRTASRFRQDFGAARSEDYDAAVSIAMNVFLHGTEALE